VIIVPPHTKRQQQIMTIAIELISEHGIQHLTIKNIAQRLKISEPAIYRHFTSKLDIVMAMLKQFDHYNQEIFELLSTESDDALAKLNKIFCGHLEMFSRHKALAAVVFAEELFQNEKTITAKVLAMKQANEIKILEIVKLGQTRGSIRSDLPAEHLVIFTMGSMRLLVKKWRLARFGFDIIKSGQALWKSLAVILKKQ
jgi:TetR/AcrR family transcriptional regulator, fatty acid metabolism regulator protein